MTGAGTIVPLLLMILALLPACQQSMRTPHNELSEGQFGKARVQVHESMSQNRGDRRYLLDRMRAGILTLADGYAESAEAIFEDTYEFLRTQGINRDRTVAAAVIHEGVQIWKGEPFEQALAMSYYGLAQAQMGSWDNLRAAAQSSLFQLRDFSGEDEPAERIDTHEIARRAIEYEQAIARGEPEQTARDAADYLDHGYVVRDSNYTLGYLLNAVANQQLGRSEEAADNFTRVLEIDRHLQPLVEQLRAGDYNTLLVVSWGLGPRKERYGPSLALSRFVSRYSSDDSALRVRQGSQPVTTHRQVLDVNVMAQDHRWQNLEDVRVAKGLVGRGLLYGGAIATDMGRRRGSSRTVYAGLGTMAAGLLTMASATADTRYADLMPQRVYVVPVKIEQEQPIMLQVEGAPSSRLVLRGLDRPRGGAAQLRYVRLLSRRPKSAEPPAWASAGQILYSNAHTGVVAGSAGRRPYVLGGRCVRPLTYAVMDDYLQAGQLRGMTLSELRDLYQGEGIRPSGRAVDEGGVAGLHVLEGGRSLVAPQPGTTGFMRLFGQEHEPYRPRSEAVRTLRE